MGSYLSRNGDLVLDLLWRHALLALIPTILGLVIAIPLGWLARSSRWVRTPLITVAGLLYTIPSLALFVALPAILGTRILDPVNVVAALTIYTVALLVRTVVDGLDSVPVEVTAAATAMGYRPLRRFLGVELPIAVPVIGAGLRVAAVSNVSLVSVAALIGVPQLGQLFTDGFQRSYWVPLTIGIVLCVVLALVFDLVLVGLTRLATPWTRAVAAR